jgi:ribonuclease J
MACLVEADDTQILYTGDIRFHGRVNPDLSNLDGLAPDIMISEGTNIEDTEPDNEKQVQQNIQDIVSETEELVMVGFAWKDLERYETVRDAALAEGRIPVFDPRLAYTLARFGRNIYDEDASVFVERCESMIYSEDDYKKSKHKAGLMDYDLWDSKKDSRNTDTCHLEKGVYAYDLHEDPSAYVLHLDFYRFKNLLDIQPSPGSLYIRAQCEPFNARMELSDERLHRWLKHFEINPDHEYKPYQFHASGHACGPDVIDFINRVKPKKVIPIHTEKPKIFQRSFPQTILVEKGKTIEF